jgi:hypothetical protein
MISVRLFVGYANQKRGISATTDPYCPQVLTIPSEYTPFIVESSDKLPAGNGELHDAWSATTEMRQLLESGTPGLPDISKLV